MSALLAEFNDFDDVDFEELLDMDPDSQKGRALFENDFEDLHTDDVTHEDNEQETSP